jgi:hypothetical protein
VKRQRPVGIRPWVPAWRPARLAVLAALSPLIVLIEVWAGCCQGIDAVLSEWRELSREWPPMQSKDGAE